MKSIVFDKYGSIENLYIEEGEKPEPKEDEVRLKVYAAALNPKDLEMIRGDFKSRLNTGFFRPGKRTPGIDVAGMVDAMGPEAIGCKWGQEVYADLSNYGYGGFAEYVCVPKSAIALKPKNLSYVESAAVPMAATTALQGLLNWGEMLSYRSAMIIGAGGGVGHFAVQIAKHYGLNVTAVTRKKNSEIVKAIGADHVISYDEIDFSQRAKRFELIFDTTTRRPAGRYLRLLTRDGRYVACAYSRSAYLLSPFGGILNNRKIVSFDAQPNTDDLATIRKLIERGSIYPRIDRSFALEDTSEALKYLSEGKSCGKVVIEIAN